MLSKLQPTEFQIQSAIVEWAALNERRWPELRLLWATPNGGKRSFWEARRAKKEGMKAGVPDLQLAVPRLSYGALFIEVKTPTGKLTLPQQRFLKLLNESGNLAVIVRSVSEGVDILEKYLKLPKYKYEHNKRP